MISDLDKQIIRALQDGLPLVERPFQALAAELSISEAALLERVSQYKRQGWLRRIGAVLRHQVVGYTANAMIIWAVPAERVQEVGRQLAAHPRVTHCYQRVTLPHWPFNFYTMVHGQSRAECAGVARELARQCGVEDYQMLFSTREFKKSSMGYFRD